MHDRSQEAEKVLRDLHQDSTESGDTYVRAEFFQIKEQVRLDLNMSSSWREIFTRPSYRRRAILTIGFAFLSQSCGPLVINNYVRTSSSFFLVIVDWMWTDPTSTGPVDLQVLGFRNGGPIGFGMWLDHS